MVMKYFKLTGYRLPLFIIISIILVLLISPLSYMSYMETKTEVLQNKKVEIIFNEQGKIYTKEYNFNLVQSADKTIEPYIRMGDN